MPHVQLVHAGGAQHHADWRLLQARREALAAAHSPYPVQGIGQQHDLWCRVVHDDGALMTGAVIAVARSRKLPAVRVGRLHFGAPFLHALGAPGLSRLLRALASFPQGPSVLSVHVYAVYEAERAQVEELLTQMGFEREAVPRTFHHSLLVPVTGSPADRLGRLSYAARRGIRQVTDRGFRVAPIDDPQMGARLAWLHAEAHRRTGARPRPIDFGVAIEAARHDPERAIVLGVSHPDRPASTALVGYAHGLSTGSSVVYASAGTERADDIGSTPLSYGLVASLLDWTADLGFPVFDFGGITPAETGDHPLAGISAFKRKFRGTDAHVASDFRVAIRPLSAAILRALEFPARLIGGA